MAQVECPNPVCGASGTMIKQQQMLRNPRRKLITPLWSYGRGVAVWMWMFCLLMFALLNLWTEVVLATIVLAAIVILWFVSRNWPRVLKCKCKRCGREFEVES